MSVKRYPSCILATVVVPWTADWRLDEAGLRRQIKTLLANGYRNLYIFGTAGEGYAVDVMVLGRPKALEAGHLESGRQRPEVRCRRRCRRRGRHDRQGGGVRPRARRRPGRRQKDLRSILPGGRRAQRVPDRASGWRSWRKLLRHMVDPDSPNPVSAAAPGSASRWVRKPSYRTPNWNLRSIRTAAALSLTCPRH